jgi:hypothetical protein
VPETETAAITEEESFKRGFFPLVVGGQARFIDPSKAMSRMAGAVPDFVALHDRFLAIAAPVEGEDAAGVTRRGFEIIAAAEAVEPAALAGLRLEPLGDDGSGVTLEESMSLLGDFFDWQNRRTAWLAARADRETSPAEAAPEPPPEAAATA